MRRYGPGTNGTNNIPTQSDGIQAERLCENNTGTMCDTIDASHNDTRSTIPFSRKQHHKLADNTSCQWAIYTSLWMAGYSPLVEEVAFL